MKVGLFYGTAEVVADNTPSFLSTHPKINQKSLIFFYLIIKHLTKISKIFSLFFQKCFANSKIMHTFAEQFQKRNYI
jgi:hypothetical protein